MNSGTSVWVPPMLLISCLAFGKLFKVAVLQFLPPVKWVYNSNDLHWVVGRITSEIAMMLRTKLFQ